ncbi:hypothetical protein EVAR_98294_1 [Eumeta japonica]|uniref:Uncharacterized protein n=1 Tax=Eumeta variegata TaxID=151549 RepID=A0A4C1X9A4_EUMVA|nr:hypothetical protein EVAR_98294_1 [Eumeta japonica]
MSSLHVYKISRAGDTNGKRAILLGGYYCRLFLDRIRYKEISLPQLLAPAGAGAETLLLRLRSRTRRWFLRFDLNNRNFDSTTRSAIRRFIDESVIRHHRTLDEEAEKVGRKMFSASSPRCERRILIVGADRNHDVVTSRGVLSVRRGGVRHSAC